MGRNNQTGSPPNGSSAGPAPTGSTEQAQGIPEAGGWHQGRLAEVRIRTGLKGKENPVRRQGGQRVLQAESARPAKEQKRHGLGTPGNEAKVSVIDRPKKGDRKSVV